MNDNTGSFSYDSNCFSSILNDDWLNSLETPNLGIPNIPYESTAPEYEYTTYIELFTLCCGDLGTSENSFTVSNEVKQLETPANEIPPNDDTWFLSPEVEQILKQETTTSAPLLAPPNIPQRRTVEEHPPRTKAAKKSRESNALPIVRGNSLKLKGKRINFNQVFTISQQTLKQNKSLNDCQYYLKDSIGAYIVGQYYLNTSHNLVVMLAPKNPGVVITQLVVHTDNKVLYDLVPYTKGGHGFCLIKNQGITLSKIKKESLKSFEISIAAEFTIDGIYYNSTFEQSVTACGHDFIRPKAKAQ